MTRTAATLLLALLLIACASCGGRPFAEGGSRDLTVVTSLPADAPEILFLRAVLERPAIRIEDEVASVNRDQCIGCGLCVSTCPTGALTLARKPPGEIPALLATAGDVFKELAMGKVRALKPAQQGKA